jgi:plasmid stabilization system protein ParE
MATHRREVIWTQRARDALDEAAAFVAEDSPEAAVNLVERALDAAESLSTLSERGRIVPELDDPAVREIFVYRYRLVYEVAPSQITVLGFLHGARDFNRWWHGE